jgi:hypothetical protein
MLAQTPIDVGSAHDLHIPAQALAQHTPCAQFPDAHSFLSEQKAPFSFRPQELLAQTLPATQFASVVHAMKQRVPLHANGAQGVESGATQLPVSLQVAGGV